MKQILYKQLYDIVFYIEYMGMNGWMDEWTRMVNAFGINLMHLGSIKLKTREKEREKR